MAQLVKESQKLYVVDCGGFYSAAEIRELLSWAEGLSQSEAAAKNHVSIHTVHSHRKSILRKSGVSSGIGVLSFCLASGHIKPIDRSDAIQHGDAILNHALRAPESAVLANGGVYANC